MQTVWMPCVELVEDPEAGDPTAETSASMWAASSLFRISLDRRRPLRPERASERIDRRRLAEDARVRIEALDRSG